MHAMKRRDFMRGAALGALAFTVGGAQVLLTAREARAQGVPFRVLRAGEAETLEALGETLLPGARAAGIAHFIDQQLSVPPEEALLEARILNVKPPYANFYRAAIGSIDKASQARSGRRFALLNATEQRDFVDLMRQNKLVSWDCWGRRTRAAGAPFILEGRNPMGYAYQSGWGGGGAALHYFANFPRLLPNDFKVKSEHNRGLDWPISYKDVAPWYDKVARDVGVSGDAKAEEIWRPAGAPYPMPPMKTFRNGDIWLKGFESVGIRMVPAAVGMNSTAYKGRPACIYDGWCHVGCPTGALSNPLVTYLADARKAGAEVRAWSTVTRVLANAKGNRVTGVEYYDRKKEKQFQPASAVVLAAWSAQNPRILLNSANGRHPKGLANRSGLVGKYMMTHYASGTWAIFDENVENHMGTTGAQYMSYDRYGKTSHKGAFGSSFIVAGSALKTSDLGGFANARLDLFGADLHAFMKRAARGLTRINAFA